MELTNKDLMKFYCCSENTATHRKREILAFFKLPLTRTRVQDIHVAKYEGLSISDVRSCILE
jgi:hypothetical protein